MGTTKYIHYGSSKYEALKFIPIKNEPIEVKPQGGLWASAVDSQFGWKDWCEKTAIFPERLYESFLFTLKEDTNILYINSRNDMDGLPRNKTLELSFETELIWISLDFEKILADGIDAIQLNLSNDDDLYFVLYGWDCDSILIMNKDIIVPEVL